MNGAVIWTLAGLGGSLALGHSGLLDTTGPLSTTFAVVPLVAGLFAAAHRIGPTRERPASGTWRVRMAAAAALALAATAQDQLALRYGEALIAPAIFAALAGLLAWQAYESLRPLVERGDAGRRAAFFLIVLAVYAGVAPWCSGQRPPDGDEPYYLLLTHSLAYDFDADLANNYERGDSLAFMPRRIEPQPGDPEGPGGERYSRHNLLLPLVLAPFYRAFGLAGALGVMALLAAALAGRVLRIGELYFPELPGATMLAASVAAFSPPLLLQSHQAWVEVPAALLVAAGFESAARLRVERGSRRHIVLLLGCALLLPLLKLRFLALALPLLALAIARAPRARRDVLARGLLALAAVAAAILLFNQASFGQALKHHSARSLLSYLTSPADYLAAPLGLLFDSSFGLFFTAPIWILVLPGAWGTWRRRRGLLLDASIVCLPYLLLLGPRAEWYGGWSPFFRYGVVFLPFLALLLVPVLRLRRLAGAQLLIAVLGSVTVVLTVVWLVVPGWTYNFANGRGYLLDHLGWILGSDAARLFPSFVRPRSANLIWPFLLVAVSALAGLWRRRATRSTWAWGVAAVLASSSALAVLADSLPTRVVEFEDPYVRKTGGALWPDRWTPARAAYRGSWRLGGGDAVTAPVRAAGRELFLVLEMRRLGPARSDLTLEILADGELLLDLPIPPSREWASIELGPLPWAEGRKSLDLRLIGQGGRLLLDRAHLNWRSGGG